MANRVRPIDEADYRTTVQLLEIGRELRIARLASGRRLVDVGRAIGASAAQVSRLERGRIRNIGYRQLARGAAVVGLRLSIRAYPGGRRLLDQPQLALLEDLRGRAAGARTWRTEVPMPIPGDLRAADATAEIDGRLVMFELWTRLTDFQAQTRAAQLKRRDLGAERLIIVLRASQANRRAVRLAGVRA